MALQTCYKAAQGMKTTYGLYGFVPKDGVFAHGVFYLLTQWDYDAAKVFLTVYLSDVETAVGTLLYDDFEARIFSSIGEIFGLSEVVADVRDELERVARGEVTLDTPLAAQMRSFAAKRVPSRAAPGDGRRLSFS